MNHFPGAETNDAPRRVTREDNAQLIRRENIIVRCATQGTAIESIIDEDDNDSSLHLDSPDVSPATTSTLVTTNSTLAPIHTAPSITPGTKTTKKHQVKQNKLDMEKIMNGNKENIKVLSTAVTTMAENKSKVFENKSETGDKRLTSQESEHKSQLELRRDKFTFEKEKSADDRMKARVNILNVLKNEALKSMMESYDEDSRAFFQE